MIVFSLFNYVGKRESMSYNAALKSGYNKLCCYKNRLLLENKGIVMQGIESRRFIRHPLCMPLSYKVLVSGAQEGEGVVRTETMNISLGGLLFSSRESVAAETGIEIRMPFEDKVFNVEAKVVRCVNNAETNLYDIAVTFLKIQEAFKVKMIEQIYLIAEYRDLLSLQLGKEISLEEASRKWIKRYSERFSKLYW